MDGVRPRTMHASQRPAVQHGDRVAWSVGQGRRWLRGRTKQQTDLQQHQALAGRQRTPHVARARGSPDAPLQAVLCRAADGLRAGNNALWGLTRI